MELVILLLVAVVLLIGNYFRQKALKEAEAQKEKEDSFLIPAEGGILQKMKKDSDDNITLRLGRKIKITDDTYIFRFSFTDPDFTFGLPIGKHVIFSVNMPTKEVPAGEVVERKYTPVSSVRNNGYVDFVIKIYRKNIHPRFPDGGVMTQYLESLEQGSTMLMRGPLGQLEYHGFGKFLIRKEFITGKKRIGMVAGGTGITPCYQVLQAALNGDDGTDISLIFGNRSVSDILLKDELDQFKVNYPERFKLHYTVDIKPEKEWAYSVGFVTADLIKSQLPAPSEDTIILYCGPPPFEEMMKKHLTDLGFNDKMVFKF